MDIVVTHNNMDFDSLAAQFAVSKLYPGTRILPGYPLVGNVREFLSLYRDNLPLSQFKYLDLKKVNHIYVVDCQHIDRLDETARKLILDKDKPRTYTVFDHHDVDDQALVPMAREDSIVKRVGSTTTIMVEELRKRKIELTPFEATLLLIGIYEDTGCLTYQGTCAEDADCVSYLLGSGADLARANDYLHPKLTDDQVKLLEILVQSAKMLTIGGSKIVLANADLPQYQEGLATLTRKLVEIESCDAVVSVVRMRDRTHLVGRSDTPSVDIRALVREFGGDGHHGAGSAVSKDTNVQRVLDQVEQFLQTQVVPETTAIEIMQTPVRSIRPRTSMEEAGRIMLRYGLDGLIVVDGDDVVGVVSRRDIDQAMHHKLAHAPVQGFMSRPVITVAPTATLSTIQQIMVKEDIGRLPVMDDHNHLLGIVTRHEVLKTLYGKGDFAERERSMVVPETRHFQYKERLEALDEASRWLFTEIGIVAAKLNMVAYAVGGSVRDLFLSRPNFDLDFVVEGAAIELAKALEQAYPGRLKVVAKHERFQTATLIFSAGRKLEVDLSTARTEFYEFPAALPTVEASGLQQDLFRRDFTINALAICLNPGRFGEVIDYFGGLADLDAKLVRILHPFSFIEDPTRIVRAARFAARLGFNLEERTKQQAERAISIGIFDDLGGVRLRTELQLILEAPSKLRGLDLLGGLGGNLRYLDAELAYGPYVRKLLRRAERLLEHYPLEDSWLVYLGLLVSQLPQSRLNSVLDRLQLANDDIAHIEQGILLPQQLNDISGDLKRSEIHSLLHNHHVVSLAIAACLAKPGTNVRRVIRLYLEELKQVSPILTGADLLKLGIPQGKEMGDLLAKILEAKLDKIISVREDEIAFVRKYFADGIMMKGDQQVTSNFGGPDAKG